MTGKPQHPQEEIIEAVWRPGEFDPRTLSARTRQHLEICAECRAFLDDLKAAKSLLTSPLSEIQVTEAQTRLAVEKALKAAGLISEVPVESEDTQASIVQPSGIQPSGVQPSRVQPPGVEPSGVRPSIAHTQHTPTLTPSPSERLQAQAHPVEEIPAKRTVAPPLSKTEAPQTTKAAKSVTGKEALGFALMAGAFMGLQALALTYLKPQGFLALHAVLNWLAPFTLYAIWRAGAHQHQREEA